MQVTLEADEPGRLICSLADGAAVATATASNMPEAGRALRDAVDDARATGRGECWWQEQGGVYWWMFRRVAEQLTVAVLWSPCARSKKSASKRCRRASTCAVS